MSLLSLLPEVLTDWTLLFVVELLLPVTIDLWTLPTLTFSAKAGLLISSNEMEKMHKHTLFVKILLQSSISECGESIVTKCGRF